MHNIDYFVTCKMQRKQCSDLNFRWFYTGLSIKSRLKTKVRASDKVNEKIVLVWDFFLRKTEIRF